MTSGIGLKAVRGEGGEHMLGWEEWSKTGLIIINSKILKLRWPFRKMKKQSSLKLGAGNMGVNYTIISTFAYIFWEKFIINVQGKSQRQFLLLWETYIRLCSR